MVKYPLAKPGIGLIWDALGVAGMAALGWGLWMAWPPLAPIIIGLVFVGLAAAGAVGTVRDLQREEIRRAEEAANQK